MRMQCITLVQTGSSNFENFPSMLHCSRQQCCNARHTASPTGDQVWVKILTFLQCVPACSDHQVKIQKMRSNLEDKLMRRMTTVHRRAEEWRATAQAQHLQQLRRAAADNTRRLRATSHHRHLPGSDAPSCACFPCSSNNNNVVSGNLLNYY